jgi:hypothetical protein
MKFVVWVHHNACGRRVDEARSAPRARLGVLLVFCALAVTPLAALADGASGAVYVRVDTDDTLVVSPRAHAATHLGEPVQIDVSYAADIWTSASIDIRASASRAVTEQRNELDLALSHAADNLLLGANYRYSVENDYESHGVTASAALDVANKSATLALNAFGFQDQVGRAGDPLFSRSLSTLGGRATLTQILDTHMLGQLSYELGYLQGYQASPYRFVGIGPTATGYGCVGAVQCFREHVPDQRLRHALALLVRRALTGSLSLGAEYRFYFDDWQQQSHTLAAQLGWSIDTNTLLTLRYRLYSQRGVWFYSRVYTGPADLSAFVTRDREQSPMGDQRIGLDLQKRISVDARGTSLVLNLDATGTVYSYDAFVGLSRVYALEITLALGLEN